MFNILLRPTQLTHFQIGGELESVDKSSASSQVLNHPPDPPVVLNTSVENGVLSRDKGT